MIERQHVKFFLVRNTNAQYLIFTRGITYNDQFLTYNIKHMKMIPNNITIAHIFKTD